ncbi:MAG: DUF4115 domain-containing protein [Candidatus Marinimicrobia bacterium]|nr:DUF4115 domain-containing protein [Candidatus Neomarinimicrobiota bacterium]
MFYLELKKRREELGLSLDQISERTKINKKYLEAFEKGDFTILPETYIRLFLRSYAKELDFDPDKIIEEYVSYKSQKDESVQISKKKEPLKKEKEKPERKREKTGIDIPTTVIVILMIIFLITIIKQVVEDRKKVNTEPTNKAQTIQKNAQQKPADTTVSKSTLITPAYTQKTDTTKIKVEPTVSEPTSKIDSFSVRIVILDTCWIEIMKDNNPPYDYIYYPENTKTLYAKNTIMLRIGKPAGVKIYFNGQDLGKIGENGIPVKLTITKDGVIEKQIYR